MEEKTIVITECFKCGTRYQNHFKASPCCKSIMMKVNEKGERTTIAYLNSFSIPKPEEPKEEIK